MCILFELQSFGEMTCHACLNLSAFSIYQMEINDLHTNALDLMIANCGNISPNGWICRKFKFTIYNLV